MAKSSPKAAGLGAQRKNLAENQVGCFFLFQKKENPMPVAICGRGNFF
jgi:hypothetical protein